MDGVPGLSPRAELGTERSATVTMRFYMTVRSPAFDTWTGKRECEPIWIPDLREYGARLASRVLLFIFSILNQPYMSGTADTWFERDHLLLTSQWPASKQGRPSGSHFVGCQAGLSGRHENLVQPGLISSQPPCSNNTIEVSVSPPEMVVRNPSMS